MKSVEDAGYKYAKGKLIKRIREKEEEEESVTRTNEENVQDTETLDNAEGEEYNGGAQFSRKGQDYIPKNVVGSTRNRIIREELKKLYGSVDSGIANRIAVARRNTVYYLDSGKDKGVISFGVIDIIDIPDESERNEFIWGTYDRAISNGIISDEILDQIGYGYAGYRDSIRQAQSGANAENSEGKPTDNSGGVSEEVQGSKTEVPEDGKDDKRIGSRRDGGVNFSLPNRTTDVAYLKAVEDGDMETAQRMVDEAAKKAGYTKLFYHGAKKGGGFTVFRDWSYFTENKAYAERYADRNNPGSLYSTYAKLEKPFDTRNASAKKIFNAIRQEYGLSEIQESGLPDWTDGYDISDYIEENDLDYDGIILDEGGDMVDGNPVRRGESYVIRKSNQIKSADPVTYDDKGNVIPLSKRFNVSDPDIRFSLPNKNVKQSANCDRSRTYTRSDSNAIAALSCLPGSKEKRD